MDEYHFYYDESEHDRKITQKTFNTFQNDEFHGNFIATISGWHTIDEEEIQKSYLEFEDKYKDRKNKHGEIKSNSLNIGDNGFASISKHNIPFVRDFLRTVSNEKIHFYFSIINKVEYLVQQILRNYKTDKVYSSEALVYIITKAIVTYQPDYVIYSIYNEPDRFVEKLKQFLVEQINKDLKNFRLKKCEMFSYCEVVQFLTDARPIKSFDWNYNIVFDGFLEILQKQNINNYSIGIDEEVNTLSAAKSLGLISPYELNSLGHIGIRISDMMSGLIGKFVRSLHKSLNDKISTDSIEKSLIDESWFNLNEEQLELYKLLHGIVIKHNSNWSKVYAGMYADDVIAFTNWIEFITSLKTVDEIQEKIKILPEKFNYMLLLNLKQHFDKNFGSKS